MRRVAVAASVVVLLLGDALVGCGSATPSRPGAAPETTAGSERPSPPSSRSPGPASCRADTMRVSVALTGSTMSQPFADIAVTNTGAAACVLRGYPRLRARGHPGWEHSPARTMRLAIVLHHGLDERVDGGPQRVVVRPHHAAYFSVGTATAYQGGRHILTLTRLGVVLPDTRTPVRVSLDLLASHPPGRPIPVGITALRANRAP